MSDTLIIQPGGKLVSKYWVYDDTSEKGEWKYDDVTNTAICRLFDRCTLDEQTTLRDVLLLLNTNLPMFDLIIGNWCKEYVCEGLAEQVEKNENVSYLELYWLLEFFEDEDDKYTEGNRFPSFHGVGLDANENYGNINIGMIPVNEISHLNIKLNDLYFVSNDTGEVFYRNPEYTLGQILYGIIWELSFLGNPNSRVDL
jgi:hypothetical protein